MRPLWGAEWRAGQVGGPGGRWYKGAAALRGAAAGIAGVAILAALASRSVREQRS